MTSFKKPTDEQVDAAVPLLGSPAHVQYFFERLENPEWIGPLDSRGFFADPPSPVVLDGTRTVHPPWPESGYLARMTKHKPEDVARIFHRIAPKNAWVVRDMLRAVQDMSADTAATLVDRIAEAHSAGMIGHSFPDATDLCARLALNGEPRRSLTLAKALFAERLKEADGPGRSDYWLLEGLQKVVPALAQSAPRLSLKLFLKWLDDVIAAESRYFKDAENDGSWGWRPVIEEHEENSDSSLPSVFVGVLREAFHEAVKDGRLTLTETLELLAGHARVVFRRLQLHLIDEFANQESALASAAIMDESLFDDYRFKHEYARLCANHFSELKEADQERWLGWVDAGPDLSYRFDPSEKRESDDEEERRYADHWKFGKLHWIREELRASRLDFYERMLAEHGEPEFADMNVRSRSRDGQESPFSVTDFLGKPLGEVLDEMVAWRPQSRTFGAPSVEGAASTFRDYLNANLTLYVGGAGYLKGRPAIYVRTYIEVMARAISEIKECDLSPLLDLCKWVVSRPISEAASASSYDDMDDDSDWRWTRDSIAVLATSLCEQGVSLDNRERLWQIIAPLTNADSRSYIGDSETEDPRIRDHVMESMNSPCGKAMRAVFAYLRWVAKSVAEIGDGRETVVGGIEIAPEVRALLESRLAPDDTGEFTLRAMFGWHIALLYWVDQGWLSANVNKIFDLRSIDTHPDRAYGWAAWNAFISGAEVHLDYYQLLREQFSFAVEQVAKVEEPSGHRERPFDRLGQYLLILYARGHLGLDDDDSIIQRFLKRAPQQLRSRVMQTVGISLWRERDTLSQPTLGRLQALWDWYWNAVGADDARASGQEVFSFWFASGRFDPAWALERLESVAKAVPKFDVEREVGEVLAEKASADLPCALRIIERLIDSDKDGWRVFSWIDAARQILAHALSEGVETRARATRIIDRLGRRGITELGSLLKRPPN